jgi:hypothetical protein
MIKTGEIEMKDRYSMLGLKLRDAFLGSNMPGTVIELRTNDEKGAVL